jgi:hypothetical protein
LGEQRNTPAASQAIALAGSLTSFQEAAQRTLRKLSGLAVSESTVERTTENAGARLAELLREDQFVVDDRHWDWNCDAQGNTCAYVELDHTGVPQQGPGGAAAEGRLAGVGVLFNPPDEQGRGGQYRYLSGLYDLDELGRQLRRYGNQVGLHRTQQWIALTDGANGLEELVRRHFPRAECILDFWHASEHVAALARALHPGDEDAFQEQFQTWRRRLKEEGGAALLAEWESLDLTEASPALREAHANQVRYFRNQVHRMDYPRYRAQGWRIGSGAVEAACKTVVGQRLKGSGMRWGEDGADHVCHLRALYLSESRLWEAFWKEHPN